MIDPASDRERLFQIRDEYGISEVWLSHAHEDHIKYLGLFDDLPLALSELDAPAMAKLLNLLREPRSFEEIVDACIVYWRPREPREFYDLGERGHMVKHLEKLIKEDRVAKKGQRYVTI